MSKAINTGIELAIATAQSALNVIEDVNATLEEVKDARNESQNTLLVAFQDAEQLSVNAHAFKKLLCEKEGYSFKMYDASNDKMVTIDGKEAPNVFKVNMSVATKAFSKVGSLSSFATWKELRDSLKEIDPLTDHKNTFKAIMVAMKSLNNIDTNDEYLATLERIKNELETAVNARKK